MAGKVRELVFSDGTVVAGVAAQLIASGSVRTFADDSAFATAKGSAAAEGDLYGNTTINGMRYHNGSGFVTIIDTEVTAILSNKTLVDPLINGGDLDVDGAGAFNLLASVGANDINIGGATSHVKILGDMTVSGTTTTIDTENLNVTDQNININDGGNDATAEGAGLNVERVGTDGSFRYEDALASKWKIGAVGSESEVADVSSAQTFTTKTIDADNNTITNLAHGAEVDDPSTGVHGVGGGAVVGTNLAQVITNKDVDGGTASNTDRITLPKNTKTNLDGLTRKAGTLVYDTTNSEPLFDNGTTLQSMGGGGGGSGDGEINYITNSDAEAGVTDWNLYNDGTTTEPDDGDLGSPLGNITIQQETGGDILRGVGSFHLEKTSGSSPQGNGVSFDFTIDAADANKAMKLQFDYHNSADFPSDGIRVFIYDVTNATLITPSLSDLGPSTSNQTFFAQWISTDSTSYRLIFHYATTVTAAIDLFFDRVIVGPGQIVQTAVVGQGISYTPVFNGLGTPTVVNIEYYRSGEFLYFSGEFTTGTTTASEAQIGLPLGLTVSGAANKTLCGTFERGIATNSALTYTALCTDGDSFINIGRQESGVVLNPLNSEIGSGLFGTGDRVSFFATVKIAEWVGSGTANVGQNNVEYASNSSTDETNDTASFVNGPNGSAVPTSTAIVSGSVFSKTVRFTTPILSTDTLDLQIQVGGAGPWLPIDDTLNYSNEVHAGTNSPRYGISIAEASPADPNKVRIRIGKSGCRPTGTGGYASAGLDYPGNANDRWRIIKHTSGVPVAFGLATETTAGLAKGLKKYTESEVAISGFSLGAVLPSTFIPYQLSSGEWYLKCQINIQTSPATSSAVITIAGINTPNINDYIQTAYVSGNQTAATTIHANISFNSNSFAVTKSATSGDKIFLSADIELDAKPSWAD